MRKHRSIVRMSAGIVLAILIALTLGSVGFAAGICEEALLLCFYDPYKVALGYIGLVECGLGYIFCKQYIDPN